MAASSSLGVRAGPFQVQPAHPRSRSVDMGTISSANGFVMFRMTPDIPKTLESVLRKSEQLARLLQERADDSKMQVLGSAVPKLCMIPQQMYGELRRLVRSGHKFPSNVIIVSFDLEWKFLQVLSQYPSMIKPFSKFLVSHELTESAFDQSSQRSSGSSSMLSSQWLCFRLEVFESEQDSVAPEDWESVIEDMDPVD
jgi:hypothetical protein